MCNSSKHRLQYFLSEQVKEFWKSGISIHSTAWIIYWSCLEGTSRGFQSNPLLKSRANFNVRSDCSGPPAKVWKSASMEIRSLSALLLLVFNPSHGEEFCPYVQPVSPTEIGDGRLSFVHCALLRGAWLHFSSNSFSWSQTAKTHSFPQAEQTILPQHLLTRSVLLNPTTLGALHWTRSRMFPFPYKKRYVPFL